MPLLASLLVTLFGSVFAQVAAVMGTRVAVATAAIASVSVLTVAMVAAMSALAAALMSSFPGADVISLGLYLFVPPAAVPTLAAVFTCDAACAVYRWKVANVRMIGGVA